MEYITLSLLGEKVSRIALGTRDCGKRSPKDIDEKVAAETMEKAVEMGVNFFVTAPAYGFTENEKLLGKFVKERGLRDRLFLSTKAGLRWKGSENLGRGSAFRDASKVAIIEDCENSLKRMQTDYIDLYSIHWPDPLVSYEEMAEAMKLLREQGKIRAIGVSNFSPEMMREFQKVVPIHAIESLYNMFEREIEIEDLPYCLEHHIAVISYRSICGGLLTGNMEKFEEPKNAPFRKAAVKLQEWAKDSYNISLGTLAVRWGLDRGISVALWGAKRPTHLDLLSTLWDWHLSGEDLEEIESILTENVPSNMKLFFGKPPPTKETMRTS